MIAIAPGEDIITSKGAKPGDILIMTKECALLSTAILSLSFPQTIKQNCGEEIHRQGCELFYKTSAVQAGLIAGETGRSSKGITAMHDVTEGGVLGALYELAQASTCGLIIDEAKLPIGEAQRRICDLFNIDPKNCVGAGSMIIAAKPTAVEFLISRLQAEGIKTTVIGSVVEAEHGIIIQNENDQKLLIQPYADPYWSAFFSAYNKGWK